MAPTLSAKRLAKAAHPVDGTLGGASAQHVDELARKVAQHIAGRTHISRNMAEEYVAATTRGERAADAVASFGGSWTFVGIFAATMIIWIGLNAILLARSIAPFDPYPYILLNLFLSMLAAIQAPVILMSQNRQSAKDRLNAQHDYQVNLKAEVDIMLLHDKVDALRERQWAELLATQKEQLAMLAALSSGRSTLR